MATLRGGDARMLSVQPVRINGYPGFIVERPDGLDTMAFQPGEGGRIAAIYLVRNPDKLTRLPALARSHAVPPGGAPAGSDADPARSGRR